LVFLRYNIFISFYFNAIIAPAVVDDETDVNIPGMKPDADTNVNTEPSIVCATRLPVCPIYKPPATNGNEPIGSEPVTAKIGRAHV
jgi:hypothetical protein